MTKKKTLVFFDLYDLDVVPTCTGTDLLNRFLSEYLLSQKG